MQCICAPSRSAREINHKIAQNSFIYINAASQTQRLTARKLVLFKTGAHPKPGGGSVAWNTSTKSAPTTHRNLPRRHYFFAERLPAPFLGGPFPLRFNRSALFCQYLRGRVTADTGQVKVLGEDWEWAAHSRVGSRYTASSLSGVMYLPRGSGCMLQRKQQAAAWLALTMN